MDGEGGARRLRAALAACGGIADLTLQAAAASPDFLVAAIQDPRAEALERAGGRYGIAARHLDFADLLQEDVDFVIVNSPNHLHAEHVEQALAHGKPCLVQKPLAPTLAAARALVARARRAGLPLGVMMFEHGKPLHHQVRKMVQGGWPGEPALVQALSAHDIYLRAPPPADDWRRDPEKVGGGAFIQLAVHHINLARWLLGREIACVAMLGAGGHTVFADESDVLSALFADGPAAQFAASYAAHAAHFLIAGTRGMIDIAADRVLVRGASQYHGPVFAYEEAGEERVYARSELEVRSAPLEQSCEVHGRFARWLRDGAEFECTAESALCDMQVIDAAYRSRDAGRVIFIE
ncbi:MAG: Gfo/Idh/MocA family oxidoreductase [Planctomycetes bacterium]|nr:Gfo/Idh/MocA family oxidoreductase [Planctomycetota bacterium]